MELLNGPQESGPTHWMAAAKLILADLPEWCGEVPYPVKKTAVEDACKAVANGCRNWKKGGEQLLAPFPAVPFNDGAASIGESGHFAIIRRCFASRRAGRLLQVNLMTAITRPLAVSVVANDHTMK